MKTIITKIDGFKYCLYPETKTAELIESHKEYSGNIIIPSTILHKRLFSKTYYNVTSIGIYAFARCSALESVTISDGIKTIGCNAFIACSSLTSISIPDSVINIGEHAFQNCSVLKSIKIKEGVESIQESAFEKCIELASIILPSTIKKLGKTVFKGCENLKSIELPENIITLEEGVFMECSSLASISIPNSIETIQDKAFQNCTALQTITIPENVINIGYAVWEGCSKLTSIAWNAKKCTCTEYHVKIDGSTRYFYGPFAQISKQITSFTIGESVCELPEYLCYDMSKLTCLTIPCTVKNDTSRTFSYCTSLKCINLTAGSIAEFCSNGVIKVLPSYEDNIDRKLIINGQEVTEITIPNDIFRGGIPNFPFKNCSSITSIILPTSLSDRPSLNRIGGFQGCSSLKTLVIPHGYTSFERNAAFKGCSSLESIVIPDTITSIGYESFKGCVSLKNIELPESLTYIGASAFEDCTSLTAITIPKNVNTIAPNAFKGCTALTSIHWNAKKCTDTQQLRITTDWQGNRLEYNLVDSPFANIAHQITTFTFGTDVECIPARLCYNMTQLKSIFIPYNVKSIGNGFCRHILDKLIISHHIVSKQEITDFVHRAEDTDIIVDDIEAYCLKPMLPKIKKSITGKNEIPATDYTNRRLIVDGKEILDIIIPNTIDAILDNTFKHFVNIKSVVIPNSVTTIGNYAFDRCISLPSITIPSSVKHIGNYAFASCSSLESIFIPTNIMSIGDGAFKDCLMLKLISLPDGLEQIGAHTFSGCSSLTSITIPNSVRNIGENAFKDCSSLTSIIIPDCITSIGEYAFFGCSSICSIIIPDTITSIGNWVFSNCTSLALITLKASSIESFCESNINMLLHSAQCLAKRHLLINDIDTEELTVPESVTTLKDYAFYGCSNIVTVTLPATLIQIGEHTFDDCESLQKIRVPMNKKEEFCKLGLELYREYIEEIEEIVPEELQQEVNILLNIAKGYELGIGMAKNLVQAVLIYSQAAEKGCAEAAYHLGELYEKGEGLPQDYKQAIDWYAKAVSLYHPSAEERKKHCEQILQKEVYVAECQFDIQKSKQTAKYIFFDTECNRLPFSNKLGVDDTSNWPRMIQLAWLVTDEHGNILKRQSHIIYPQGFIITNEVENLTGITTSRAKSEGVNLRTVLNEFMDDLVDAELVIGHNIDFDKHVLGCELYREGLDYDELFNKESVCTMQRSTNFCAIPNPNSYYGGYKWPKLEELYQKLFNTTLSNAHDALSDVEATRKCYFELKKQGIF